MATQMVENFFRSKQCDPSSLPPPNSTRVGVGIDGRVGGGGSVGGRVGGGGGGGGRARLPVPAVTADTMVGRLVPSRSLPSQTAEISTSGRNTQAVGISTTARNAPSSGMSTAAGESTPLRVSKSGSDSGGGGVVGDGPWGGELLKVLKIAGCEKHFERFKKDQMDLESLQLMEEKDFEQMGVTRVR